MPAREFDILGFGTIAVDDTLYVQHYPAPDQKSRVHRQSRSLGGQVATALAAAARLGARCAYAARLGTDDLSGAARTALAEAGINCRFVVDQPGSGPIHSIIIVDESANTRNIFFDPSRIAKLALDEVGPDLIGSASVLLVDQLAPDAVIRAASCARRLKIPIVMDLEWADSLCLDEMMAVADHLLVPRDFATAYTGLADPAAIVWNLHCRHPRSCTAVTCGKDGCYFVSGRDSPTPEHMPAPLVETVDTTGCGDVFHGGYAAALAGGKPVVECLRFASAAAAAFASRPGGWRNLPALSEVNAILQSSLVDLENS